MGGILKCCLFKKILDVLQGYPSKDETLMTLLRILFEGCNIAGKIILT